MLKSALPGIEQQYTWEKVFLKDFHKAFPAPLARVRLNCPLVEGAVTVAVGENNSLPIPNANFLLANDLAGKLVVPPLITKVSPLPYNPTAHMEKEHPQLFHECAVTRAQIAAAAQKPSQPLPTILHSTPHVEVGKVFTEQLLAEAQRNYTTFS